jgi:phosphomannomutase
VEDLASATLRAMGHHVTSVGLCATPTLGYAVRAARAAAGVMVTASHNPVEWNALKFLGPDGGFVRPSQARRIFAAARRGRFEYADYARQGSVTRKPELVHRHAQKVLGLFPRRRPGRGFHIVLDTVNGAGCVLIPDFLRRLGHRVTLINGEPSGLFAHGPEPLPGHLRQLGVTVRRRRANLGIAVDPDADRVAFVDEQGHPIGEERSLGLATDFVLGWRPGPVVVNLSTSRISEELAYRHGQRFYRTPVGEAHVAAKMAGVSAAIGGEGNGGVMYPRLHPGRDALVGIAFVLELLQRRGISLAEAVTQLPAWHLVKTSFPRPRDYESRLERFVRGLNSGRVDRRDGVRIDWPEGWVQMRRSNTEPIVRVMAEARTRARANALLGEARKRLNL